MTLPQLTKTIKGLQEMDKYTDALNTALKAFEPQFNFVSFGRYEALVVNTLKDAFDDKYNWIEYFIYDCEYGTKPKKVEIDGKKITLKTIKQLYNILCKK